MYYCLNLISSSKLMRAEFEHQLKVGTYALNNMYVLETDQWLCYFDFEILIILYFATISDGKKNPLPLLKQYFFFVVSFYLVLSERSWSSFRIIVVGRCYVHHEQSTLFSVCSEPGTLMKTTANCPIDLVGPSHGQASTRSGGKQYNRKRIQKL